VTKNLKKFVNVFELNKVTVVDRESLFEQEIPRMHPLFRHRTWLAGLHAGRVLLPL
jgi:hypothetical protein